MTEYYDPPRPAAGLDGEEIHRHYEAMVERYEELHEHHRATARRARFATVITLVGAAIFAWYAHAVHAAQEEAELAATRGRAYQYEHSRDPAHLDAEFGAIVRELQRMNRTEALESLELMR